MMITNQTSFQSTELCVIIRSAIEWEYIHKYPYSDTATVMLAQLCMVIYEFGKRCKIIYIAFGREKLEAVMWMGSAIVYETVVFRSRHHHIDVVVPWYYAMVTYCAECRTVCQKVGEMLLMADVDEVGQYTHERLVPPFLHITAYFYHTL